ncbi:uncharacterized protein LOC110914053 [Helianthus annuus]|uniref:uncharacterized protein LOC110914053 n=1 Tax=Helianthus annuus TaxID=4232 RepID=UPI000B8FC9C5|nr:uncharacterized protein LOC110914053 [Helianthus annuus]
MEPRNIFQIVRNQYLDNLHVQKDVQNAVKKIRASQIDGKTHMQALETMLYENHFIYQSRQEPETDVVTELFFVHPQSSTMWCASPYVLLIDATYKININNMSSVQVVGLMSTRKSFCIAHVVICKERSDNFVWVFKKIKLMLHECMEFSDFQLLRLKDEDFKRL